MICKEILDALLPITDEEKKFKTGEKEIDRSLYMSGKFNVINSKKLLSDGKLITVRKHSRFVEFPEHIHDYIEMVYMCSGSTTHIIDGNEIVLKQGDLLLLNQYAKQRINRAEENDLAVNFIVLPEFFDQMIDLLGEEETPLRRFIIDCLCGENNQSFLHFEVGDILPIQNLVENLIYTLFKDTPNKRSINQITMGLLFLQLMNHTERLAGQTAENDTIIKVLSYIEENYKDASLTSLADLMHIDVYALSREIKRKTGENFTDILQRKRLNKAAFLLKNSNLKISDIADKVGYDNLSYFHRIFKELYSCTPKKYRDCK